VSCRSALETAGLPSPAPKHRTVPEKIAGVARWLATIGEFSLRDDERNSALPWLPKKSYPPIDAVQKPYYGESRNKRRRRLATTALPGLAPVRSTRASAATHRESISPCRHADLGVANGKVTIRSDGIRLSAAFLRPARAHLRRAEINP
jgi:hypothetical protein